MVTFIIDRINSLARRSTGPVAPNELFTGHQFNWKTDARAAFGSIVVAEEPDAPNTMAKRARVCIVLCKVATMSMAWHLLDAESGTVVTRASWKEHPGTEGIIASLNKFALHDAKTLDKEGIGYEEHEPTPTLEFTRGRPEPGFIPPASVVVPPRLDEARADQPEPEVRAQPSVSNQPVVEVQQDMASPEPAAEVSETEQPAAISEESPPPRRSERLAGKHVEVFAAHDTRHDEYHRVSNVLRAEVSHIYVHEARNKYKDVAQASADEELREIMSRGVLVPLTPDAAKKARKLHRIVKSLLFFKEKTNKRGDLVQLKARLVAMDNSAEAALHPNKSSPTVRLESVLMALAIAGSEGRKCAAMDIGNAYLEADMGDEEVFIELDAITAKMLTKLFPELQCKVNENGKIVAKLAKALYGCVVSARLWYNRLRAVLEKMGFKANDYDQCVFNTMRGGKQITICVYVDDLLVTSLLDENITWVFDELSKVFKKVKIQDGESFEYVSLEIHQRNRQISIRMEKYIKNLLDEWKNQDGRDASPASPNLFKRDPNSPKLGDNDREVFHRMVAKLLYLAKRVAPDILLAVNFLAGFVKEPTQEDEMNLDRVFRYLRGSKDRSISYWRGAEIKISTYIDAAFACHEEQKSRSGCVLMCAGSFVGAWSSKQSVNAFSSTEAELIALSEDCSWVLWAKHWLESQGHEQGAVKIFQDNTSVLSILKKGPSADLRTRYLSIRYFFMGDIIKRNEAAIEYCPTGDMLADMFTKPLVGAQFQKLRDAIVTLDVN